MSLLQHTTNHIMMANVHVLWFVNPFNTSSHLYAPRTQIGYQHPNIQNQTQMQALQSSASHNASLSWSVLGHVLSEEQSKDGSDGVSDDGRLTIVQCHHYHRPPLSDLYQSSVGILPPLRYHQNNLHSYHCHYQPTPCAFYHSTTTAPPCSTHVPCSRPITSRTHLLGDAPRPLMFPPIFLCHLCIFLLIVASPRQSALAAPIPESGDHVM